MTVPISAPPHPTFTRARARVPGFCRRHFTFRGSLRLHRAAIGWDLLVAPLNVVLAVGLLGLRILGGLLALARLPRAAQWCRARRVLRPTALGRRIEHLIRTELLRDPNGFGDADLLADYAGTRTAVSDMTTSLGTLTTGAIAFKTVTPGVVSLAPFLAVGFAQSAAVAAFPLGGAMGSAWYWMFPTQAPIWMMALFAIGLLALASVLTTFAGIIADPVQRLLGLHQRRLYRLIDRIEADATAAEPQSAPAFGTKEHLLARFGDLADIVLSAIRHLRP